jgi:hypothetical protein
MGTVFNGPYRFLGLPFEIGLTIYDICAIPKGHCISDFKGLYLSCKQIKQAMKLFLKTLAPKLERDPNLTGLELDIRDRSIATLGIKSVPTTALVRVGHVSLKIPGSFFSEEKYCLYNLFPNNITAPYLGEDMSPHDPHDYYFLPINLHLLYPLQLDSVGVIPTDATRSMTPPLHVLDRWFFWNPKHQDIILRALCERDGSPFVIEKPPMVRRFFVHLLIEMLTALSQRLMWTMFGLWTKLKK